ncbi:hypothetical protein G3I20_20260 [Streptomyces sp. SID8111]|uniref:hypothetical protein n=1 Tax=Streptomyces sp. SID8111 TaxID=2706100 RepID=UPI0013C28ECB|nr:hypothetical protein [Streptomyces sp. SID8111]NEC28847.1 hypothetical protein [Streptomyces sp. SID8111]
MPASTRGTRGLSPSVLDLLDVPGGRTSACPGCGEFAPGWTRVDVDGLSVLTHDGDVICPRDRRFGYRPATAPVSRRDDVTVIPSPCMGCGADVDHWRWANHDGTGVLVHDTAHGAERCPSGQSFDWATGAFHAPAGVAA